MLPDNIKDLGTKIVILWQKQFKYSLNVQKKVMTQTQVRFVVQDRILIRIQKIADY